MKVEWIDMQWTEDQLSVITDLLHSIQGSIHLLWGQLIWIVVQYSIPKKKEKEK